MDGGESPPPVVGPFTKLLKSGFKFASKLPPPFSRMLIDTDLNSKTVVLNSSKGSWEIDVKKCEYGCVHFLGKSWEGYVSHHNLKEGDAIVFEHSGRLHFNTTMFYKTGSGKNSAFEEEEEESSSEDDVDKDFALSESEEEEEGSTSEHVQHLEEKDDEQDIDGEDDVPIEGNYGTTADQNENSSFQITIARWTFQNGWTRVPELFAMSNDMMQNKTVKLRNGTGNSWLAKLQVKNTKKANKPSGKEVLLTGLVEFLRENKLEIRDKCTFNLAQPSRSSQDQDVVMDVEFERRKRPEQKSKSQFQSTLAKWNITHYYVNVPMAFARSNDMVRDRTVKLRNGTGDSWLVKLSFSNAERANGTMHERVLLTSLGDFLRGNDLKVGDTCIFKLVQPSTIQEEVVMDVVVLRKP